ncbi:uncharacterized protein B4U80_10563 [Leptotrombidium deliense]|uniref:Uncharacterized protein n=1 Tax=Leptotrombidium deliense TaxID=299467 RepID=A0A443SNA2_9ACAR|nr:uncharacterized protein B4U80_10563 [Leptotrombidium deliense]
MNGQNTATNTVVNDKLLEYNFSSTTKETLLSLAKKLVEEDEQKTRVGRKNGLTTSDTEQSAASNVAEDKEEDEITGLILSFSDDEHDNVDKKSLEYGAMANNRVKQGDFKGAIKLYSLAISLNENDFRFFCNRSFCYEHLKQYKLALSDADAAIRLLPFRPKPHFMRGKALIGLRRYEEAEREFKLAEKMDPECKDYYEEMVKLRNLAFYELGFDKEESIVAAQRYNCIQDAIDALLQEQKHGSSAGDNTNHNQRHYQHNNDGNQRSQPRAPVNIFGYKAIWIGNVGPRCKSERLREAFGRYGRITVANIVPESFCAFVCFDNARSPCAAIADLYENIVDGISNGSRCLKFRFAPGKDQDKNYHKTAHRKSTDECYFWRTTGCTSGDKCKRLHLSICKGIDFQPWMSSKK